MNFSLLLDSCGIKFAGVNSAKLSSRERFSGNTILNLSFNHKTGDLSLDCSHLIFTFDSGEEDLSEESWHPALLGTQLEIDRPSDSTINFILETPFLFKHERIE